ncbi:MAG: sigma factor-like helix-turn-helix DNA-binding protein [Oscillospiraceae bacterium]
MKKDLRLSVLTEIYGAMLTEKQRDVLELYYNEDLSLAEIAENMEISRQGVRDTIKRGEETVLALENALGLSDKMNRYLELLATLTEMTEDILTECRSVNFSRSATVKVERLLAELGKHEDLLD